MTTTTQPTPLVLIKDRNEAKFLSARGFLLHPFPRDPATLDFEVEASEELFQARRDYALNGLVHIQDYIRASKNVEQQLHEHRQRSAVGGAK